EMPEMQKIYQQYQDKGIEVLGVDVAEDPAKVQQFIKDNGYSWHFVLDHDGSVSRRYFVQGLPTHLFIGRDGVIQDMMTSMLDTPRMQSELGRLLTP
ncbi:MAG TPA: TlpA disulfide reductase family protein, partial [Chloroflexia bacterium]|nr:TlpA disulfide reductase family protein [Chloroflexia bacterium]